MSSHGEVGHREALARTALLIDEEWFGGDADRDVIADTLLAGTVRLTADTASLSTRAGQTALITTFMLIARMGIGIEFAAPNTEVIDQVAPLREPLLSDALIDLALDLVPGAHVRTEPGQVQETFAIGTAAAGQHAIRVWAGDTDARLVRGGPGRACAGEQPYGGLAAGAAAAPIALEALRPQIEAAVGVPAKRRRPTPGPPVTIRLTDLFPRLADPETLDLGRVDAISGGAITHAAIYSLLRIPRLAAQLRVIERQAVDLTNVNRYSLMRRSDQGTDKVMLLQATVAAGLNITGVQDLYTPDSRDRLPALAPRVLVGVDDVRARWWVSEDEPGWLAIAATGNNLAQLTVHYPGGPCAACAHPEPITTDHVPTISFVSFWAGLLQACALIGGVGKQTNISILPFALGDATPVIAVTGVTNAACPIGCAASKGGAKGLETGSP